MDNLFDKCLTFATLIHMNTKSVVQIGMREFLRNIKDIKHSVLNGQEFEVLDHATPVFRVVPTPQTDNLKYAFADLSKLQFSGASQTLARDVDELVYGK